MKQPNPRKQSKRAYRRYVNQQFAELFTSEKDKNLLGRTPRLLVMRKMQERLILCSFRQWLKPFYPF